MKNHMQYWFPRTNSDTCYKHDTIKDGQTVYKTHASMQLVYESGISLRHEWKLKMICKSYSGKYWREYKIGKFGKWIRTIVCQILACQNDCWNNMWVAIKRWIAKIICQNNFFVHSQKFCPSNFTRNMINSTIRTLKLGILN